MRQSAFRGTFDPNRRPFVSFSPDCYVSFQGETSVIGCGECKRKVNYNSYITQVSTEASVDAPPGNASISMSIPDNDKNDFYSDGQFLIIPMMEVEIFAKGYYLIGGVPQYYRIFWGIVQTVTKNWSNGVTSISISCKDILRWWELTNVTQNPAFLEGFGSSAGHYQLFQNQFAGQNPYTTILQLASDAMGDFMLSTGSFTSYRPEKGAEKGVIASYSKDIMLYWQLKFSNIASNLVLFGASGQAYSFSGVDPTVSPDQIAKEIFDEEIKRLNQNQSTNQLFSNPKQIATATLEIPRAGDVEFFQNTIQSKLTMAMQARDQMGYEFYCDTTGDIIFKPPFYNLNVLPNKPVSWIQDFDIIDDSVTDSESEVVTHVTSSGNAFGGKTDWGLNDEITTPRTGVFDYHLLRRYGWRRAELQLEWAGNPRKLFFHLIDWMDRLNARRQNGSVTIPMRPELRMGFPVWIPKYDSFFYVNSISHQYSVGGQATTTVQLIAKRSKFIAPKNIGQLVRTDKTLNISQEGNNKTVISGKDYTYNISFPDSPGATAGISNDQEPTGKPAVIRDPNTGKILGFPNAVMVFRSTIDGTRLAKILQNKGKEGKNSGKIKNKEGIENKYQNVIRDNLIEIQSANRGKLIARLRAHRYEAGMTNMGAYDYAHDKFGSIKEMTLVPIDSNITWNPSSYNPNLPNADIASIDDVPSGGPIIGEQSATVAKTEKEKNELIKKRSDLINSVISGLRKDEKAQKAKYLELDKQVRNSRNKAGKNPSPTGEGSAEQDALLAARTAALDELKFIQEQIKSEQTKLAENKSNSGTKKIFTSLNVLIRPVSDEFGFEVIGHYRYGRGSFLDRGKVQIQTDSEFKPDQVANRLNIQFAPSGGLITESVSGIGTSPEVINSAQFLEQMQPDDWRTGATFSQYVDSNSDGIAREDQITSAQTYSTNLRENKGISVYIEADAVSRAKTLAEMSPTLEIPGFSDTFSNCACGIGKTSWLSVLPRSLIQKVLQTDTPTINPDDPESNTTKGFFQQLDIYLRDKFNSAYVNNARREDINTGKSRNVISQSSGLFTGPEQDNVLGSPGSPLFDRAALGDPDALRALQNQANLSFGLSKESLSEFKKTVETESDNIQATNTDRLNQQPPQTPTLSSKINESKFDFAGVNVYTSRDGKVRNI